jgi:hypothetical protein
VCAGTVAGTILPLSLNARFHVGAAFRRRPSDRPRPTLRADIADEIRVDEENEIRLDEPNDVIVGEPSGENCIAMTLRPGS